MLRPLVATFALVLALPGRAAFAAGWPAEVTAANHALETARSFRITSTEGARRTIVEIVHPDRERIDLNGQTIVRIGDRVWLRNPGESWKDVSSAGRGTIAALGDVGLPPNAFADFEGVASDGVAPARMYHIIYPGGTPQVRWYVRVSDGKLHLIRRAGRDGPVTVTVDQYDRVPAIDPPLQ